MKYERFEDLPVWQKAIELAKQAYDLTKSSAFQPHYGLRDQLERAALSVSNNIAEGFERGSTGELLSFLYIARGSAGEVRSMLHVMDRLPEFVHLKSQISDLKSVAESCSRQIRAWADNLQDSPIRGQRHLTAKCREIEMRGKSRAEFLDELKRVAAQARSAPKHPEQ